MKRNKSEINLIIVYALLCFSAGLASCKKLIQTAPNSPNQVITSQVFGDSTDAVAGVVGLYGRFSGQFLNITAGGQTIYQGLSADELQYTPIGVPGNPVLQSECYNDLIPSTDSQIGSYWGYYYSGTLGGIYQQNACLEGLKASTGISNTLKNQLVGEVEVVRAYYYFNMVNWFGGVPLVTTTNYNENESLPRATVAQLYSQITADLIDAQSRLTISYPSAGKARPNKYTALALLAKVYLYNKDYKNAYLISNQLINSGTYSLEPNLNNVFLDGSNEAIWQIPATSGFGNNYQTTEGFLFVPNSQTTEPPYIINQFLLAAFENGDQRMSDWLNSISINGKIYYYPFKYKNNNNSTATTLEDYMIFRLGEQYLIRAESQAQPQTFGNGLNGAVADMNVIRNRAGLAPYSGSMDQAAVLTAIIHERQVELFCELGNRWNDIKRNGLVDAVMSSEKPATWPKDGHGALYPIPFVAIQQNSKLIQNPGY